MSKRLTRKWQGEKWSQITRSTCPLNLQIRWLSFGLRQSYRIADLWCTKTALSGHDPRQGELWLVRYQEHEWCQPIEGCVYLSYDPVRRVWASNGWNFKVWTCNTREKIQILDPRQNLIHLTCCAVCVFLPYLCVLWALLLVCPAVNPTESRSHLQKRSPERSCSWGTSHQTAIAEAENQCDVEKLTRQLCSRTDPEPHQSDRPQALPLSRTQKHTSHHMFCVPLIHTKKRNRAA